MDILGRLITLVLFSGVLKSSSHRGTVDAIQLGNFTNLMYQYFLACGYSYICNPSRLGFIPNNISADIVKSFGYIRECQRCSCEGRCVSEGNCCPDVYFSLSESKCKPLESVDFSHESRLFPPKEIDIVDKCPISEGSNASSDNCTKFASKIDQLHNMPVTSRKYFQTFRNKYCAECNNVTDYEEWGFSIMCNSPADFNYLSSYDDIVSLATSRGCIFEYQLFEPAISLKSCEYHTISIGTVLYDKCNQTGFWKKYDDDIVKACESGYSLTYRIYKNIFCYICNPPSHFDSDGSLISDCNANMIGHDVNILKDHCKRFGTSSVMKPYKNVFCYLCNAGRQDENIPRRSLKEGTAELYDYFGVDQKNYKINLLILNIELNTDAYESFVSNTLAKHNWIIDDAPNTSWYQRFGINITNLLRHQFGTTGHATYCDLHYTQRDFIVPPGNCSCNPTCVFPYTEEFCCSDVELGKSVSCYNHVISKQNPNMPLFDLNYAMIDTCFLNGNKINETQKYLCEYGSGRDVYSMLPVVWNDIIYKNVHCFFCNLESTTLRTGTREQLPIMDVRMYCDQDLQYGPLTSLQNLLDNANASNCHIEVYETGDMLPRFFGIKLGSQVTQAFITDDYEQSKKRWEEKICNTKEHFACNVTGKWKHYDHDVYTACEKIDTPLLNRFRSIICKVCNPTKENIYAKISSCSNRYSVSNDTMRACQVYPESDAIEIYKNAYCKNCNGFTAQSIPKKVIDTHPVTTDNFNRNMFVVPYYQRVLKSKTIPLITNRWQESFYDEINGVVRNITCFPGSTLVQGQCIPLLKYASNLRYSLDLELEGNVTVYSGDISSAARMLSEYVMNEIKRLTGNNDQDYELIAYVTNRPCYIVTYNHRETVSFRAIFHTRFLIRNQVERHRIEALLVNVTSRTFNIWGSGRFTSSYPIKKIDTLDQRYLDPSKNCSDKIWQVVQDVEQYTLTTVSKLLLCPHTVFSPKEFSINSDGLSSLTGMETNLSHDQYMITNNGTARICVDDLKQLVTVKTITVQDTITSMTYGLNLTNFICVCLSLLCLFITFLVYCTFSSLRSLPGKNNMILVLTLFLSQLALLLGTQSSGFPKICMTIGIVSHYFVLCMFASMNVCSFHMHSVFVNTLNGRSSNEFKTFIKYLVYIFALPFAVVGLNVAIVYQITNTVGYGNNRCFISDQTSFIASFYVPVILLCVFNIFLFLRTIYAMRKIPKLQSNKKHQNTAKIYAKLFTITGITWILIIIDANLPVTALSFIATALNASQGVFIFISFVCNKRVVHLYRDSFRNTSTSSNLSQSTQKLQREKSTSNISHISSDTSHQK